MTIACQMELMLNILLPIYILVGGGGTSVRPVFRGGLRLTSLEGGPRTLNRPH